MKYQKVLIEGEPFNPYNSYEGIFIPTGLVECTQINDSVKILLGRLFRYAGKNGKAYPYRETLLKECGFRNIKKLDRTIRQAKDLNLIKTTPHITKKKIDNPPSEYVFLYSKMYDSGEISDDKNVNRVTDKNVNRGTDKNVKQKRVNKKRVNRNNIINNINESVDSYKQGNNVDQKKPILKKIKKNKNKQKLRKNKSFAAKLKKRKLKQQKIKQAKNITTKPKYKHTIKDLRNYNELIGHGITDHRSDKPKNNSIDKLHALFSSQCKDPYHTIDTPEIYVNFKWDMDLLIEVFEYHLKHTVKFNMKPVKSIGNFIFSEGYNGFKSWSPLVYWHQKMTKTAENELTEEGKKFLLSLKRAKVHGIRDIDSSIINKVAKETYYVANNHVFMDDKTITMSYPRGIIDTLSSYIKEQTNRDNFKLVYITKNGFIDEFLDIAKKRNIIKLK